MKLKELSKNILSKEKGTIYRKDPGGRIRVCLIYPNTYFLGMSNLGFHTLYRLFNEQDECVCERGFLPEKEMFDEYARKGVKSFSLESSTPLYEFDVLAFSISFEEDYVNIPKILKLCGLPVFSKDRGDEHPVIMAGGCAVSMNPEPLADIIDFFFIGEAEGSVGKILEPFKTGSQSKKELLDGLKGVDGVYIPSFYEFTYDNLTVKSIKALNGAPLLVKKKRWDGKGDIPHSSIITEDTEFSSTYLIEIERGCGRLCRFCGAGFMYLPLRFYDKDSVKDALLRGFAISDKVGLIGAAVSEYPHLKDILRLALERGKEIGISSLRLDMIDGEMLTLLKAGGLKTLTVAPEAATERMRRVINKGITDDEIFEKMGIIKEVGFKRLKLYFMVGLPTETDVDIDAIGELAIRIKKILKGVRIILSINPFIPKPFTPFERHPFEDSSIIEKRLGIIKKRLYKEGGFTVNTLSISEAAYQAFLSRADRRAGSVILRAAEVGWKKAVKEADIMPYIYRKRNKDEILPWDVIATGLKKSYLRNEYERALEAALPAGFVREKGNNFER